MVRFSGFLFFFSFFSQIYAQTPVASFSLNSSACINEKIEVLNQSVNSNSYEWDFCLGDIRHLAQSTNLANVSNLSWGAGYKLVQDNGNWYGFVTSFNNNRFFRLDFGNDPGNTPTVHDYGDLSGQLLLPFGLDVVYNQGEWLAFISSYDFNAGITLVTFGSSLTNTPTAVNIGRFNQNCRFTEVKAIVNGTDNYLILDGADIRSIVTVNFKNSYHNTPATGDIYATGILPNVFNPFGFDVINKDGSWIVIVANTSANQICKINFGTNLQSTPTVEWAISSIVTSPIKVKVLQEGSHYYAIVAAQSQSIVVIDIGDLSGSNSQVTEPTLPSYYGFDVLRLNGKTIIQGANDVNSIVNYLKFENVCSASTAFSTLQSPAPVYYTSSGTVEIELVAKSSFGTQNKIGQSITITSSTAPDISFSTNGFICTGSQVIFSSSTSAGNISSYTWNYGDGTFGSGSISSHSYGAGNYNARLSVVDAVGCNNFSEQNLSIYNIPQVSFGLPAASPFCTNQNYLFTNNSTYDLGSNPTWQWSVNGNNVSTSQDLSYQFTSNADQTISLTASIPGCSTQAAQTISSIQIGPQLSFTSPTTSCVGTSVPFTNTSSGSVLGYTWTFGDGNSSTQTNAANPFAAPGVYTVSLSAANAAGCQNSFSNPITIYSNPQPDFSLDLPPFSCAGSSSQFNDLTPPLADSNLSTWTWSFGDPANGASQQRNATYTYSAAGNYNVSLQVTSNFGCSGSVKKSVTISPSPQALFTNSVACVNQSTQFTDASIGNIQSWQWKIQNTNSTSQNTNYTFKSASSYPVSLTVKGSNGCLNQITKNITVPVAPVMDFSILYPCAGNPSQFQETNPGGSDPATAWNWNFSVGNANGNPATYTFPAAGLYTVTLTSTRQSQCVYSVSKNLTIVDGPSASFTASSTAGGAPLQVTFSNTSSLADTYSWSFGDANGTSSTDQSPSFTYNNLGSYTATLTASNSLNCSSTASTVINVVVPNIDAAMNAFELVDDPASSSKRPFITIKNNSNIAISNMPVSISLGGEAVLNETINETIQPGFSLQKLLTTQIASAKIDYICAVINYPRDAFAENNEQCVSLTQDEVVLSPYPNPASTEVTVDWINPDDQEVHVIVFSVSGQVIFDQSITSPSGLTHFKINTSSWASGLYLIQITGNNSQKLYRVAVIN